MAKFNIGDKVIDSRTEQKGTVTGICPARRGGQYYEVFFAGDPDAKTVSEICLRANFDNGDPFARCKQQLYGTYDDFARINTSFKIQNSNNSTISSLKASTTIFKSYQFKPLLKFLNSDNKRLLIADEVGLGKTIEAGHIMLELQARHEFRNVLIICTKSLCQKWQEELKSKFDLSFDIYTSRKEAIQALTMHDGNVRGIINYTMLQYSDKEEKKDTDSFIGFIKAKQKRFSLVLCDEAHQLRNSNTRRYNGAEELMRHAQAGIFMTATPIMLGEENLFNLMHLLDDQRFDDFSDFRNALSLNAPFIRALSELGTKKSLKQIAKDLSSATIATQYLINENVESGSTMTVDEWNKDSKIYQGIIQKMTQGEDTLKLRAELQCDLNDMSQLNEIFSRTRKREVTTDWTQTQREPHLCKIELTQSEREEFDRVIEEYKDDNSYTDYYGEIQMLPGASLGLVQKKRQVASSVWAYRNEDSLLEEGLDIYENETDSKVEKLLEILKLAEENKQHKVIVFAIFRKTLQYLTIRLNKAGIRCAVIHGGVKDREAELNKFRKDPDIKILLSSEVGSEGLDMQFCSTMINYDLPWNPMVVEQRIGRIDRFGQKSPVVNIYNFVVADSIQEEIYERLLCRIGIFRNSIGDMEAILDAQIESEGHKVTIQELYNKLEKDLFCTKLTRQQREKKMLEVEQAIENERKQLQDIDEGLTNTLTNDSYFRQEIDRILKNSAYVTEEELETFVRKAFQERLSACTIEETQKGIYRIATPKAERDHRMIISFLTEYQPADQSQEAVFNHFKARIDGETEFFVTFNQQIAYENRNLIYLNIYHPLVQASLQYFIKKEDINNKAFKIELDGSNNPENLPKGKYFLAIYQIETQRTIYNEPKKSYRLFPVLYDIANGMVIPDDDFSQRFFGLLQQQGKNIFHPLDNMPSIEEIEGMEGALLDYMDEYTTNAQDELASRTESKRISRLQLIEDQANVRLKRTEQSIEQAERYLKYLTAIGSAEEIRKQENVVRLAYNRLELLNASIEARRKQAQGEQNIAMYFKLLSINLTIIS